MQLREFVKHFTFTEPDRSRVTLGSGTRLNPSTHRAQLAADADGKYSTADDLYVKTWVTQPQAVREWLSFEAEILHKRVDNEQKTSARFRLSDGTDEYYWDGSQWAVDTTNWNSEAEVAANISSFSAASRKLQVVVNLRTEDASVTPELIEVRVLYGALLDSEVEDIVLRSFVPMLRESTRAVTRVQFASSRSCNKILVDDLELDGDYRVIGVDSAFNHTDDPNHDVDLFESFTTKSVPGDLRHDGTVDVIRLSAMVPENKLIWLRLLLEPDVMIETSRDYYEVAHYPCIVIESISFLASVLRHGDDHVGNRATGTARALPAPRQGTLQLVVAGITDKIVDGLRLSGAVSRFLGDRPMITSTALDERYRLRLVDPYDASGSPNAEDTRLWRKTINIENFCVWEREAKDGYLIKRFMTTGNLHIAVE